MYRQWAHLGSLRSYRTIVNLYCYGTIAHLLNSLLSAGEPYLRWSLKVLMMLLFSVMQAYIMKQWNVFRNSPGWTSLPVSLLKLCMGSSAAIIWGSGCWSVMELGWSGCCVSFGWGSKSWSRGSSNSESDLETESASTTATPSDLKLQKMDSSEKFTVIHLQQSNATYP